MALFFHIDQLDKHMGGLISDDIKTYIRDAYRKESRINNRLKNLEDGAFEKVDLGNGVFALEQAYVTKLRSECFYESHRQYIDVQCMIDGKEKIDLEHIENLEIEILYDSDKDLIKYVLQEVSSSLLLRKGMVAVFYPEDAHMPCIASKDHQRVIKTVVKVPVAL